MKRYICLILIAVLLFSLSACAAGGGKDKPKPDLVSGWLDDGGKAYICIEGGYTITIDDKLEGAFITPDRSRVICLDEDGRLYHLSYDKKNAVLGEDITIAKNVDGVMIVCDAGLVYLTEEGDYYRYSFADESKVKFKGSDIFEAFVTSSFNIVYCAGGNIYLLPADSEDNEKLGSYENDPNIVIVSEDGKTVVWSDIGEESATVYVYENGERTKLGDMEMSFYSGGIYYDELAEDYLALYSISSSTLFLKPSGGEHVRVKFKSELSSCLGAAGGKKFEGLYVSVNNGDELKDLYYISKDGEKEKLLSGVKDIAISGETLYYLDEDNALRCAKLKGMELGESERIASDVYVMYAAPDSGTVFYYRDCEGVDPDNYTGEGSLYYFSYGGKAPVKISSGVFLIHYEFSYSEESLYYSADYLSEDGKTVYFFKDAEKDGDYNTYANLYSYTLGADGPVKISGDVLIFTLNSQTRSPLINPKFFTFARYSSDRDEGGVYVDAVYYNGEGCTVFAKEVIYG